MKRIACSGTGLVLFLGLAGVLAGAQNQAPPSSQNSPSGSSLGDYARQIRKDPGTKTTPKVFDNDNLPREDKLSVIGQTPAPASDISADKTAQSESPATGDAKATGNKTGSDATDAKAGSEVKAPLKSTPQAPDDEANKQAAAKQWSDKVSAQKEQIDLLTREAPACPAYRGGPPASRSVAKLKSALNAAIVCGKANTPHAVAARAVL